MSGTLSLCGNRQISILHICSDFAKQEVYSQLVQHLSERNVAQRVFVPVRTAGEKLLQPADVTGRIEFRFEHLLRPWHRLLFRRKVSTIFRSVSSLFDLSAIAVTHAHFLYSDGAVALRLKRSMGIPYVTAVRNTDVNAFMKYRPDLCRIANQVLMEASSIVFLSPAYHQAILERSSAILRERIEHKMRVIPNGISVDWTNTSLIRRDSQILRLLYVGDFSENKNLWNTLRATALLAERRSVQLTLVGSGGSTEREVRAAIERGVYPFASCLGYVSDLQRLQSIYRSHDVFVMPSLTETFGVAYIEALSQGLPVIHSRGQGVDGFFPGLGVSEAVDPLDVEDIADKIELLAERSDNIREDCVWQAKRFEWQLIADQYTDLYREIGSQKCQLSQ